ncbi:unnamed protein product [Caenorhabditis angaria]|uniref:RGS domain-containing protein n=1 Tax=Caenorhabditis angaria TaxID=860376 RepID=A0A9P1J2R0_9PELO|nr:unnamed protein product [Caenorhabditis angaria]
MDKLVGGEEPNNNNNNNNEKKGKKKTTTAADNKMDVRRKISVPLPASTSKRIVHKWASVREMESLNVSPPNTTTTTTTQPTTSGPISKTLSYLRNKMDSALSTSSLYPSKEEVRLWERNFEALLNSKYGCALFRQFLKKEFSDENVDFWLECEDFKKMKDGKKGTTQKAIEIYREYVVEHSPKEVNLDSDTRAATKAALENGCRTDTFSLAQNRVEQLMAKDSYRRFLRDRLFLDLIESFESDSQGASTSSEGPSTSK